jgi:hypothetical protein
MRIIGFNFTSISARADGEIKGEVSINSTPNIESIEKHDLGAFGIKEAVEIKFKFVTSYEPKVGEIEFKGDILYQVDDTKKILKLWKDGNKMEDKMALDLLNTIFRRCFSRAVELADSVRLPPPIRFPVVTTEKPTVSGN